MTNNRIFARALIIIGVTLANVAPAHGASASAPAAGPVGNWLTAQGGAVVQITACRAQPGSPQAGQALPTDALCGRLVGIKLNRGTRMPRDYMGDSQCDFPLLQPAVPARTPGVWRGHIIDPRSGHVYQATLRLTPHGRLALHGYLLLPVLGETQYWTRYTAPIPPSCRIAPARPRSRARPHTAISSLTKAKSPRSGRPTLGSS